MSEDDDDWQLGDVFTVGSEAPTAAKAQAPAVAVAAAVVQTGNFNAAQAAQQAPQIRQQKLTSDVPAPIFIRYPVDDPAALAWATERLGGMKFRADAHSIAKTVNDRLVGVVVFDTFSARDCMVHVVSDGSRRWMSREFIIRAMAYPFNQLRFTRITCAVSEANMPSLDMTKAFGWVPEGRLRRAAPDGKDLFVFGMLREECHWLQGAMKPRQSRL